MSSLRILVTNDDGIYAPGLKVLEKIARALSDDVWVVAPEQEQSGAGHSLTLSVPVRVRKISARRYAISGTPTDCVLLARSVVVPSKRSRGKKAETAGSSIDLVLSGVNRGSNVGDDITYSGTVAAAMEATLLGIPAIALSQLCTDRERIPWDNAGTHAVPIIKKLLKEGWPRGTLVNLNFPDCAAAKVKGIAICQQGQRKVSVQLTERKDPRGRPYFWIGGDRDNTANAEGVDIERLEAKYITVTPVQMDLTDYPTLARFNALFD